MAGKQTGWCGLSFTKKGFFVNLIKTTIYAAIVKLKKIEDREERTTNVHHKLFWHVIYNLANK